MNNFVNFNWVDLWFLLCLTVRVIWYRYLDCNQYCSIHCSNLWIILILLLVEQAKQNLSYLQKLDLWSFWVQSKYSRNTNSLQQSLILHLLKMDHRRWGLLASIYSIISFFFCWLAVILATVLSNRVVSMIKISVI